MPFAREEITMMQLMLRFEKPGIGGLVDLRRLDLTSLNMQDEIIKGAFTKVAEAFEASKEDPPGYIDMTQVDISGLDMRGYNLSHVILTGASTVGTVFVNCVLSDTQFDYVDARNADFRQADLYHTKMYETNIDGVNFSGSKLTHTHGLGLRRPDIVVERLGAVGAFRGAELPSEIEPMRGQIQAEIEDRKAHDKPLSAADLSHPEIREDNDDGDVSFVEDQSFFGSAWLRKHLNSQ